MHGSLVGSSAVVQLTALVNAGSAGQHVPSWCPLALPAAGHRPNRTAQGTTMLGQGWHSLTSEGSLVGSSAVEQLIGVMNAGSAGQRTACAQLVSRSTASNAASKSFLVAGCSISLVGPSSANI